MQKQKLNFDAMVYSIPDTNTATLSKGRPRRFWSQTSHLISS